MQFYINSKESQLHAFGQIKALLDEHRFLRVSVVAGRDRSREQNALAWTWYNQIAIERGEDNPEAVHTHCKAYLGIPILRGDDAAFNAEYERLLLGKGQEPSARMSHEQRMFFIRHMPVTSLFTTKQMARYLEDVQRHYASLDTDPVQLDFPDERD